MRQQIGRFYEFGPFVLDTAQHLLSRQGQPVALTPKTYDILLTLVENHGRMLSKEELMKTVWPNSIVEESNLTQQISMIRKALGETAGEHRYIVTIPGRGYRFAAEVKEAAPEVSPPVETIPEPVKPEVVEAPVITTSWWEKPRILAILILAAASLIAFVFYRYQRSALASPATQLVRTLAILPFQNLQQDPKSDFLGFSLADAVITKLDYVSSLVVRPSSAVEKYRKQADVRQIATDLHVNTLLTGNFIRDGDDLRITTQLIDVNTQSILWKRTFDVKYNKLLTVQDAVAQEIIRGLKLSLSPQESERIRDDKRVDPIAYEYYLRGVDLYSRNDYSLAIQMLQKSIEIDPSYALTWAQLGRAHTANASFELGGRDEYRAAQVAYDKALAIQPNQIEAQIYKANRLTDTGHVEEAVPILRAAEQTNSNHAEIHWELGYAYRFAGMLKESAAECERARELDPGVKLSTSALNAYLYLGQYDKFLDSLPKTNDSALLVFYRGFGEYYKRNWEQAAKHFDAAFDLHPSLLQARVGKALSYGIRHEAEKGLEILREAENTIRERGVGDSEAIYKLAQGFAVLGDKPAALRVLKQSVENGFFSYAYFQADPLLESLRNESEYEALMKAARDRQEAFRKRFF